MDQCTYNWIDTVDWKRFPEFLGTSWKDVACVSSWGSVIQSYNFPLVYSSLKLLEDDIFDQYFSGLAAKFEGNYEKLLMK